MKKIMSVTRPAYLAQLVCLVSLLISSESYSSADKQKDSAIIRILNVETFNLAEWETLSFEGLTQYSQQKTENMYFLRAESKKSASGMVLKKKIDLTKTPYLNWSWRLEKGLLELPELTKAGDDYAGRVYLIYSGGWFFWQTKALNYIWSSRSVKEAIWPNAYAPNNALMKAVRDNTDKAGVWYVEKRHVLSDIQSWLGDDVTHIDGIAIMTDTDNSQADAILHYGDIFFSAH